MDSSLVTYLSEENVPNEEVQKMIDQNYLTFGNHFNKLDEESWGKNKMSHVILLISEWRLGTLGLRNYKIMKRKLTHSSSRKFPRSVSPISYKYIYCITRLRQLRGFIGSGCQFLRIFT